jgi:tripartite-type tricarboxylate transporter receptor subunit TctC
MLMRGAISVLLFAAGLAGILVPGTVSAQSWPTRPVTMVVPFAPGSSSDTVGRVIAAKLSDLLTQPVVVESVSGGGGMIGTSRVAKSPPDGYQFVFASVDSMAIVPSMHKKPLYNSVTDFAAAGLVVEQPIVLLVRKDLPANTMAEFVAYAKANHRSMQFGSAGVGSGSHFSCAQLSAALGIEPVHVPYRGGNLAVQDVIAGRLDFACPLAAVGMGALQAGSVKPIALLTDEPSPLFPDVKTAKQQGVAGVSSRFWTGFFYPKDTPEPFVRKLNEVTTQALEDKTILERLKMVGVTPVPPEQRSPAYLQTFVKTEVDTWAAIVKASGVSID